MSQQGLEFPTMFAATQYDPAPRPNVLCVAETSRLGFKPTDTTTFQNRSWPNGETLLGIDPPLRRAHSRPRTSGKERDSESGLDNFGARYNSSQYGRFMTPDVINLTNARIMSPGTTLNKYVYAADNPLKYVDRDGKDITIFYRAASCTFCMDFGHIFIGALNQNTGQVGFLDFYPPNGTNSFGSGPGEFNPGDRAAEAAKYASLTIQTTPEEAQKVLDLIKGIENGSVDYSALTRNCTTVCEDALRDLGLDFGSVTPYDYWSNVYRRYSQQAQNNPFTAFPFAKVPQAPGTDYGNPRDFGVGMDYNQFLFELYQNQMNQQNNPSCSDSWDPDTNTLTGCP